MNVNVGTMDRVVRAIVGAVLVVLYLNGILTGTLGAVLLVGGIVLILTALVRFCPVYQLLGVNSCRR